MPHQELLVLAVNKRDNLNSQMAGTCQICLFFLGSQNATAKPVTKAWGKWTICMLLISLNASQASFMGGLAPVCLLQCSFKAEKHPWILLGKLWGPFPKYLDVHLLYIDISKVFRNKQIAFGTSAIIFLHVWFPNLSYQSVPSLPSVCPVTCWHMQVTTCSTAASSLRAWNRGLLTCHVPISLDCES